MLAGEPVSGGSQSAKAARPRGDASSVTGHDRRPISRAPDTSGSETVADASTNVGSEP